MIDHADALRQIIARAQEDAGFRARLKAAPHAALTALFGMDIPAGLVITVLEDTPAHIHIVLPAEDELSDEALDQVAGGGRAWNTDNGIQDTQPPGTYQPVILPGQ